MAHSWRLGAGTFDLDLSLLFGVGDKVVVNPVDGQCTSRWKPGVVTGVNYSNIEVDGMPRHEADIRDKRVGERPTASPRMTLSHNNTEDEKQYK